MNLSDYEFFPGSIIDVDDPKYLGRVKAIVPTLFDTSMNKDGLPWIRPFTMSGYQRFSKMLNGSKIWVFRNKTNYTEFWYIPMFELNGDTRDIVGGDDTKYSDSEVILNRNMGSMSVRIYYNANDGIIIKYGDENYITINPDGEAIMKAGDGMVKISGNHVYLGDGDTGEPAVMGNKLVEQLEHIKHNFEAVKKALECAPYPKPLMPIPYERISTDILADNTSVD